jgi:hypothetical protein
VRLLFTIALLEASTIGFAVANPIAIDCGEPIALIAESVNIAIHESQSVVSGAYSFRQVSDGCPHQPDDPITIKMPIIVQGPQSFASLKSSTAVSLTIGRRVFHPSRASVDSPLYDLPSGWKLYYLEFEIPRRALRSVFTAAVRYIQPHLPGSVAPYYPIHPPERWAPRSIVRYSVAEPASLALVSKGEMVVEAQRTRISVQPQHHKLILVRVNKT